MNTVEVDRKSVASEVKPTGATRRAGPIAMVGRALIRRCPHCGSGGIFRGWFELESECPRCGLTFEREEGYWTGAMLINLVLTELIFLVYLVVGLAVTWPNVPIWPLVGIGVALNVAFPIFFYPLSKTVWMALDLSFHPLEAPERKQLR
ncbi:MAG: DUF983 domain-containing protein [Chloroflexi bacterium]|nr:DUF983 domain-containing protein [Chloroflexota bacterium]